jgi:cell division protein FtsB
VRPRTSAAVEASVDEAAQDQPAPGRAATSAEAAEPSRSARLTGRAAVLVVVLGMLAVAYAWPLREFLRQRSDIARLRSENASTQARVDALEEQKQRWSDPAYIEAQARDRLHFVMPGETAYVVLQPGGRPAAQTLPPATPQPEDPWYAALWQTVRTADDPAAR